MNDIENKTKKELIQTIDKLESKTLAVILESNISMLKVLITRSPNIESTNWLIDERDELILNDLVKNNVSESITASATWPSKLSFDDIVELKQQSSGARYATYSPEIDNQVEYILLMEWINDSTGTVTEYIKGRDLFVLFTNWAKKNKRPFGFSFKGFIQYIGYLSRIKPDMISVLPSNKNVRQYKLLV